MNKLIYHFGCNGAEGNISLKKILGNKGANLAEMSNLSLPVPDGFTISTKLCHNYYNKKNNIINNKIQKEIINAVLKLEKITNKKFGSQDNPLLLSVRSSSVFSMPGMMDTVLNLGMNDKVIEGLIDKDNNPYFVYDSYRRFLEMYSSIVLGIPHSFFSNIYEMHKKKNGQCFNQLLKNVIADYKLLIKQHSKREIDSDPYQQLYRAIIVVIKSWDNPRAVLYRKINHIPHDVGTAVNVQTMVFGNKGKTSGSGVVFTRSPVDGKNKLFGEFLINAQGEDIVSGNKTPYPIFSNINQSNKSMESLMPDVLVELKQICERLECHYKDMQDIEFTIEERKLYILQTRIGKRSSVATVKIATDMVRENLISKQEALIRVDLEKISELLYTTIDYSTKPDIIAKGLPASPGVATGIVVFSTRQAEKLSQHHKVILVRVDTNPEDIKGMNISEGIITARGGMTSHAAVVARGLGKPCVCAVQGLIINEQEHYFIINNKEKISNNSIITIDGSTGNIIVGVIKLVDCKFSEELDQMLKWADQEKRLKIRANAETVCDVANAIKFGAEGIGLCRTEHMFFQHNRIELVQQMIIATDLESRMEAINKLLPLQIYDFKLLLKILDGKPINIRLLDPPLHEFLPKTEKEVMAIANLLKIPVSVVNNKLNSLREINPMLGNRGCRLGISFPEIYIMQIKAIFLAIYELSIEEPKLSYSENIEVMIPLVFDVKELEVIKSSILQEVKKLESLYNKKFKIKLGTMIELPRAALTAYKIAPIVDYFSFGTNDLTQTTFGISRDDTGVILSVYLQQKILEKDPFVVIDKEGVGLLIKNAINQGLKANPSLKLGVCGEHAGNPESIDFFHNVNVDYVSCSPYRIPIARIAAAQSMIKQLMKKK